MLNYLNACCRHPIFDRPQALDVIVWTLDDPPCSCFILSSRRSQPRALPQDLSTYLFCAWLCTNDLCFCFWGKRVACWPSPQPIGQGMKPSALFSCHRPKVLADRHCFGRSATFVGQSAMFSGRTLFICFKQIFNASYPSWYAQFTPSIHVYGGICPFGLASPRSFGIEFYKKGAPPPFSEVLKI